MIGKDDKQEEVSFKVADRRKFNPDGSLKEGVTLEPVKVVEKPAETKPAPEKKPEPPKSEVRSEPVDAENDDLLGDEEDFADADDPTSFVHFLSTLATNAAAALGAVPHPGTGQRSLDLETGKYWLDVLGSLQKQRNLGAGENRRSKAC
jgi:hypothetical protein